MEVEAQQRVQEGGQSRFRSGRTWPERVHPLPPAGESEYDSAFDVLSRAAYQLLARARQLSTGNATDRQLALIFAMSACDMHMEQALTTLLKRKGSRLKDISALVGHTNTLASDRVQKVYASLTHDMPWGGSMERPAAPWWKDWLTDRDLKHAITRDGGEVSLQQAARCIKTSVSYLAHVSTAVSRALDNL
jgi:hypothetical protein